MKITKVTENERTDGQKLLVSNILFGIDPAPEIDETIPEGTIYVRYLP